MKNTKQVKGIRTTVPKRDAYSHEDHTQTKKKVDLLTKCYVPENINIEIVKKFEIKVVEHKE